MSRRWDILSIILNAIVRRKERKWKSLRLYGKKKNIRKKSSKWTCLYCFILVFTFRSTEFNGLFLFIHTQAPLFLFLPLLQAQIKILNLMDKKEKTAQALSKKKNALMELEARFQKVRIFFFFRSSNVYYENVMLEIVFPRLFLFALQCTQKKVSYSPCKIVEKKLNGEKKIFNDVKIWASWVHFLFIS